MAPTVHRPHYDVVVAGAGPVGLFLACELALASASVIILERNQNPIDEWKVLPLGLRGMNTSSVESLYRRGLMDKFFDPAERLADMNSGTLPAGHFADLWIDGKLMDLSRWKYRIPSVSLAPGRSSLEQVQTVLTQRAKELGVEILLGSAVEKIVSEDEHKIVVVTANGETYEGSWLVGCDGGRSAVRKAAGIELVGTEAKMTCYPLHAEIQNVEKLQSGFVHTDTGMYIMIRPGVMYLIDYDGGAYDRSHAPSQEHLQSVLSKITGTDDVVIKKVKICSSFTDRSKIVTTYHKGRVFLAGDACHIHPPFGAQGLNLGLGDAFNLGWKLASAVKKERQGESAVSLLDTYEVERRPIAEGVIEFTRAQVETAQPGPYGVALRRMVRTLMDTADGANYYADKFWGLSQRYVPEDTKAHAVVGRSAPDFELEDGSRLGSRFHSGAGLLIDFGDESAFKKVVESYGERIDYHNFKAKDPRGLKALLVRPDGFVAWAQDEQDATDHEGLETALKKWFM